MAESSDHETVHVFIGVGVGKDTHHAVAVNRSDKRLFDKALPNAPPSGRLFHCVCGFPNGSLQRFQAGPSWDDGGIVRGSAGYRHDN